MDVCLCALSLIPFTAHDLSRGLSLSLSFQADKPWEASGHPTPGPFSEVLPLISPILGMLGLEEENSEHVRWLPLLTR